MKPIPTLYLSYDGMTDPLGQSQVIPYLQGLSQQGYQITLISFEKAEMADRKPHIQQLLHNAGIEWHPLPYTKSPPVLSTIKDIWAMKRMAWKVYREKGIQVVHCRSYIAGLVGLGMKRKLGTKFIFDMRGFWADERIDGGIWSLENPIFRQVYRYFKKKEIQFFSEADYTISLTHNGKQVIHSWGKVKNQPIPIKVIPCCVDTKLFQPEQFPDKASIRKELNLPQDALVLTYLGSIGTWYMLPEMLAFFKELKNARPSSKMLFITGEKPEKIYEEAQKHELAKGDFVILKAQREEVPRYLKASDLSIFFIKPVFSKKASSPTKQGEIMSMGIPIICNTDVGDTDHVIKTYEAGILISSFNTWDFQQAIEQLDAVLASNRHLLQKGAKEFYGLEEGIKRYTEVYKAVLE